MVWSNWRGALVVMAAWVALACSQAFTQSGGAPGGKAEKILTLYEQGKAIKCRVLGTWNDGEGKTAHQLQSVDTGELITIVEMGPAATPVASEGRRSIRTRNFHWGRSRIPPAGCPMPPSEFMTVAHREGAPAPVKPPTVTPPTTATPPSIIDSRPPIALKSQGVPATTQYLWWEEKDGKRVSPIVTTKNENENPFDQRGPIVLPASGPPIVVSGPTFPPPSGPPIIVEGPGCPPCEPGPCPTCPVTAQPEPAKRVGERIRELFTPAPKPVIVKETPKSVPFSTAADPTLAKKEIGSKPAVTLPETKPLHIGDPPPLAEGKDWRKMWGSGSDTVKQPGQSLVTATAKPGAGPDGYVPLAAKKTDILASPERFDPPPPRYAPKGVDVPRGDLPMMAPPVSPGFPMGAQSVVAAKSGLSGPVTYIPVPITTVPAPTHPPMPPPPRVPEPPQPTAFVNAFTPPPAPPGATMPPAMAGSMPYPGMMHPGMMNPAMMNAAMMNAGAMRPPMMPTAYPGMPTPGMPMPYGYAPVASASPPSMYSMPRHYAGPMPPYPHGGMPTPPVAPVGYTVPVAMPGPSAEIAQLLMVVRESPYPAQREWAATQLSTYDWRAQPEIVPALIQGARHDPAATVRAGCVYSLSRMNAASQPVLETLTALRGDSDSRVRQEVENALVRMGFGK